MGFSRMPALPQRSRDRNRAVVDGITTNGGPDHEKIKRSIRADVAARYRDRIAHARGLKRLRLRCLMRIEAARRFAELLFGRDRNDREG